MSETKEDTHSIMQTLQLLRDEKPDQEECIARDHKSRSQLKQQIVVDAKRNLLLEHALARFEKKIMLRLRERISDEEVIDNSKFFDDQSQTINMTSQLSDILQRYGNLLYFIQSDSKYLCNLLNSVAGNEIDQLIQLLVFTLYANPYDAREENLLLALIRDFLDQRAAECKDYTTFLRENSAAPKMLFAYTRRDPCKDVLKNTLTAPMKKLLDQSTLNLEINPRKILEGFLVSGKSEFSQTDVDSPEIQRIVQERVNTLKEVCDSFLQPIYNTDLPTGMKMICKILREVAENKFPHVDMADQLIGGFVFLRFYNPALTDARTVDPKLNRVPENVRRNLVIVAKVLQNLSNGVLFGEKEQYMTSMNDYLSTQLPLVKAYFRRLTNVHALNDLLRIDRQLEDAEPFVYISLKEITTLHNLIEKYLAVIADQPSDPIHLVLQYLNEYNAREVCVPEGEKFVTLRLVDWIGGGQHRRRPSSSLEDDPAKRLQSFLLPVLRTLSKVKEISSLSINKGDPCATQLTALLDAAAKVAKQTDNLSLLKQIEGVQAHLSSISEADRRVVVDGATQKIIDSLTRRQLLQVTLAEEVIKLKRAFADIQAQYDSLQQSVTLMKQYLKSVGDQTFYKLGWGAMDKEKLAGVSEEDEKSAQVIQLDSVLSTQGLIGGLLSKVQRDVADSLTLLLHDRQPDVLFENNLKSRNKDVSPDPELSILFPRSCDFYSSSLSTFATVGKCCLNDMVCMILKTLPSMLELKGPTPPSFTSAPPKESKEAEKNTFSWAAFFQLVPTLKISNPDHIDMLDSVVELMAVDILCAILQHYGNSGNTTLEKSTVSNLQSVAFAHFLLTKKPPRKNGLRKHIYATIRQEIADKWGVVLGLLCPFHMVEPLEKLSASITKAIGSNFKDDTDVEFILRGVRYLRFTMDSNYKEFKTDAHLKTYLNSMLKLFQAMKNNNTRELSVARVACESLELALTTVDFTQCLHVKDIKSSLGGSSGLMTSSAASIAPSVSSTSSDEEQLSAPVAALSMFSLPSPTKDPSSVSPPASPSIASTTPHSPPPAPLSLSSSPLAPPSEFAISELGITLSKIFFEYVGPLYYEVFGRYKFEDLKINVLRLCNTVLLHAPQTFFEPLVENYVSLSLAKGLDNNKKRSTKKTGRMACILHFLRGGGAVNVGLGLTHLNGHPVDRHALIFGSLARKIPEKILDILFKKLFDRKAMCKLPDLSRIVERIVIQFAVHNFRFTVDNVLKYLFNSKVDQEQLTALRVLEILVDQRSGSRFRTFALRGANLEGKGAVSHAARTRLTNDIAALSSDLLPTVLQIFVSSDLVVGLRSGVPLTSQVIFPNDHGVSQDAASEKWISLDLYDLTDEDYRETGGEEEAATLFKSAGPRATALEVFYHALRLFPAFMPQDLMEPKPDNCSINGLFIGKLLVHPARIISRTAFEALKRTMMSCPSERSQVIESFLHLVCDEHFQDFNSLSTLVLHLISLLKLWSSIMIEDDANAQSSQYSQRFSVRPVSRSHSKDKDRQPNSDVKEISLDDASEEEDHIPLPRGISPSTAHAPATSTPSSLRWRSRADAVGLVYVAHPDAQVRSASLQLLNEIQHLYRVWCKISSGIEAPVPKAGDPSSIRCLADIIQAYNDEIMRTACTQYTLANMTIPEALGLSALAANAAQVSGTGSIVAASPNLSVVSLAQLAGSPHPELSGSHSQFSFMYPSHCNTVAGNKGHGSKARDFTHIPNFDAMVASYPALLPHGVAMLARMTVELSSASVLGHARALLLSRLKEVMPSASLIPMSDKDSEQRHFTEQFKQQWINFHAIYFALCGIHRLPAVSPKSGTAETCEDVEDEGAKNPIPRAAEVTRAPSDKDKTMKSISGRDEDDDDDGDAEPELSESSPGPSKEAAQPTGPSVVVPVLKPPSVAIRSRARGNSSVGPAAGRQELETELEDYLKVFWECLGTEVQWIKNAVVLACAEMHSQSIPVLFKNVYHTYLELQKKRRKKALPLVTAIFYKLPLGVEFVQSLSTPDGCDTLLRIFKTFITSTQAQLWAPKKLVKEKWSETQVELVLVVKSLAEALCSIKDTGLKKLSKEGKDGKDSQVDDTKEDEEEAEELRLWDKRGSIIDWPLEERYAIFTWLVSFTKSTSDTYMTAMKTFGSESIEQKEAAAERARLVTAACAGALLQLAGLGKLIPDNDVSSVLLRQDLLSFMIEMQGGDNYSILSLLLCFHHKFLLPVFIDKVYQEARGKSELYFRAIADVFSSFDSEGRYSNVRVDNKISNNIGTSRLARCKDEDFYSLSRANLARLIHLTLLQMASENLETRFSAFEMIHSVVTELLSLEEGRKLIRFRFAFESPLPSWAQDYGLRISETISRAAPSISHHFFREALNCLKSNARHSTWITEFLLPWAENIVLTPNVLPSTTLPEDSIPSHSDSRSTKVTFSDSSLDPSTLSSREASSPSPAKISPLNVHTSTSLLVQMFSAALNGIVPLNQMLPLWRKLASCRNNVIAIMQFLQENLGKPEKDQDSVTIQPVQLVKIILFSIYNVREFRADIIRIVTSQFIKVLQKRREDWTDSNLRNRHRGCHILGVLERHERDMDYRRRNHHRAPSAIISTPSDLTNEDQSNSASPDANGANIQSDESSPSSDAPKAPGLHDLEYNFDDTVASESSKPTEVASPVAHGIDRSKTSVFVKGSSDRAHPPAPVTASPSSHLSPSTIERKLEVENSVTRNVSKTHTAPEQRPVEREKDVPGAVAMKQAHQSYLLADMMIELMGIDVQPVLQYFPVIVIYCLVHLSEERVRFTCHQLLIRIMASIAHDTQSSFGRNKFVLAEESDRDDVSEDEDQEDTLSKSDKVGPKRRKRTSLSSRFRGPTLREALDSESLQLIWKKQEHSKIVSTPKNVVMFAESFVAQYCRQLEKSHTHSVSKIGYEALRWAVLSTDLAISNMAYTIYRSLLSPLNEASIHALLLSLLSALEDWERQGWYMGPKLAKVDTFSGPGATAVASVVTGSPPTSPRGIKQAANDAPALEACMIVDTLKAVSEELLGKGMLPSHPSLLWTAIALMRCDQTAIYNRALNLLQLIKGYPYLFQSANRSRLSSSSVSVSLTVASVKASKRPLGGLSSFAIDESSTQVYDSQSAEKQATEEDDGAGDENASKTVHLPEDFWTFSEKWNPRFDGVQPFILQGLLSSATEANALNLMSTLMKVVWDPIVDNAPTRHLITIIAFVPPIYLQLCGDKPADFAGYKVAEVLTDMASMVARFSPALQDCLAGFASSYVVRNARASNPFGTSTKESRMLGDSFLEKVCTRISEAYFPQYSYACAEYLTALLRSDYREYHCVVLKMTKVFLNHARAHDYVNSFAEIISISHGAVALLQKSSPDKVKGLGSDAETALRVLSTKHVKHAFPDTKAASDDTKLNLSEEHVYRDAIAEPAADVIATVITLFSTSHEPHSRTPTDVITFRALPIRSLRNAIDALSNVVRCSPLFPN